MTEPGVMAWSLKDFSHLLDLRKVGAQGESPLTASLSTMPAISGDRILFTAGHDGSLGGVAGHGLLLVDASGPSVLVDRGTPVPDDTGTFDQVFKANIDGDLVAFDGESTSGRRGIYVLDLSNDNLIEPLITSDDMLNEKDVGLLSMDAYEALSGNQLAFKVELGDGTDAIYLATFFTGAPTQVPSLSTPALLALPMVLVALGYVMRRRARAAA